MWITRNTNSTKLFHINIFYINLRVSIAKRSLLPCQISAAVPTSRNNNITMIITKKCLILVLPKMRLDVVGTSQCSQNDFFLRR